MIARPKWDYCMKELFRNFIILKYFISDILDIPIEKIRSLKLRNTNLWRRYRYQKQGIEDVGQRIDEWIQLFNVETEEDLKMLESTTKNLGVLEAVEEVRHVSLGRWAKARYDEHMKMVRDQNARDDYVRDSGAEQERNRLTTRKRNKKRHWKKISMALFIAEFYTNNSITNTSTQQITDTGNSPAPSHAATIPAMRAASPEMGLWVAWMMAGKVMTASVT